MPLTGNALQRMYAPVCETQTGPHDEILDRGGDEHVAGPGKGEDSSPKVNGDPYDAIPAELAFAGVETGANGEPDACGSFTDGGGTADRARRAVKRCEEAIARGIDFATAMTFELHPNEGVMLLEQLAPPSVTDLCCTRGRVHDVCEQDRSEHAIDVADGRALSC